MKYRREEDMREEERQRERERDREEWEEKRRLEQKRVELVGKVREGRGGKLMKSRNVEVLGD